MTNIYDYSEADEIAENMPLLPEGADFAKAMDRVNCDMPDETYTVRNGVAEALLGRSRQRDRQLIEARKLSDDEVRRHASIATDNGPFDPQDISFTAACEWVRRERGLPHLHSRA
jgi:hypothetical protein